MVAAEAEELQRLGVRPGGDEARVNAAQAVHERRGLRDEIADRQHAARPDQQVAVGVERDVAVAAEAHGLDLRGLDAGAPAAHARALRVQPRHPLGEHRAVGGCAAHVEDDALGDVGEMPRARDAGRRAGEDGLHGPLASRLLVDERAVALHDHDRRGDAQPNQRLLDGLQQLADDPEQTRVEDGRVGAGQIVQPLGQLVPADHWQVAVGADDFAHQQLVGGVAYAGIAGDGEGVHTLGQQVPNGPGDLVAVGGFQLVAADVHRPGDVAQRAPVDVLAGGGQRRHDDGAGPPALALHDGVGRQRRRERHDADLLQASRGVSGGRGPRDGFDQVAQPLVNPQHQVVVGRDGLGLGDDGAAVQVVQHAVGVRPPGVNAQAEGAGRRSASFQLARRCRSLRTSGFQPRGRFALIVAAGSRSYGSFLGAPCFVSRLEAARTALGVNTNRRQHALVPAGRRPLAGLQDEELVPFPFAVHELAQQVRVAGDALVAPPEVLGHLPGIRLILLRLGIAGVDVGGAGVVAFPAIVEVDDVGGALGAVLLGQRRETRILLQVRPAVVVLLFVVPEGADLVLVPAGGDVERARLGGELPPVGGARAQEERHAVMGPRDDDGESAGHQARHAPPAQPVAERDGVEAALGFRALDGRLGLLAQQVRPVVQPGLEQLDHDVVGRLRGQVLQFRFEYATGDDLEYH